MAGTLAHLRQLGIEVVLSEELPKFDEAAIEWMQETKKPPSADKIKAILRKPFQKGSGIGSRRQRNSWTGRTRCPRRAYPSRKNPAPPYDPRLP